MYIHVVRLLLILSMSIASLHLILSIKFLRVCVFVFCNIFYTNNNRKDLAIYYSVKIELLFNLHNIAEIMAPCLEEIIEVPHIA